MRNVLKPFRFKVLDRRYRNQAINLLDVGCGSHAATVTKKWLPSCQYYGIDRENYYNDAADFALMTQFYKLDLVADDLSPVPDDFFDVVIMSHVIEHLPNGLNLLPRLAEKLKTGGQIYIEFPSPRSLAFPSMEGALNFCDDATHVRVYTVQEIANILLAQGFQIIKAGTRRDKVRIFLMPLLVSAKLVTRGHFNAGDFWDFLGFADYVYAEKR